MTIDDYLDLITSAFRQKPNFTAMITTDVSVQVRVQDLMNSLTLLFDLDVAAGAQLDVIGLWVGVSRIISVPVAGIYFSWDGTDYSVGWDYGIWQTASAPTDITILPDDIYRTLIRAKIAANHWDGTTTGAYAIWDALFPDFTILIQDGQDMTYVMAFYGNIINSLTLALITNGILPLRPEGVLISSYYIPVNTGPLFGWDLDTTYVKGWDEGSWPQVLDPV